MIEVNMISEKEIVILLIFLCIWLFSAYILYKIAKKFDVKKSYWWYLIPFYNYFMQLEMQSESLLFLLLLPVVGAIFVGLIPSKNPQLIRNIAIISSSFTLLYSMYLLAFGDVIPKPEGLWLTYDHAWKTRMGTSFALGVDGFSYPMVMLSSLLAWVAVMASKSIKKSPKAYYLLMLVLSSAITGVFMARDWALFYIFWEATLIPLFFLIVECVKVGHL